MAVKYSRRFQFERRIFEVRDLAAVNSTREIDMRDTYPPSCLIIYPFDAARFSSHNLGVGCRSR